jgi:uncharacterized protein (TIGR02452 family)
MDSVKVWKDTKKRSRKYPVETTQKISEFQIEKNGTGEGLSKIKVVYQDSLSCAQLLVQKYKYKKVLVLNFANNDNPGGRVADGFGAQEEDLFRRTNLCTTLLEDLYPIDIVDNKNKKLLYALYSPTISVFKTSEKIGYRIMEKSFTISVISCAAQMNPFTEVRDKKRYYSRCEDRDISRRKISLILCIAKQKGFVGPGTAIILGAWGCGAYGNPNYEMAELFKEEISSHSMNCVFAIKSDIRKEINETFKVFKDVLEK